MIEVINCKWRETLFKKKGKKKNEWLENSSREVKSQGRNIKKYKGVIGVQNEDNWVSSQPKYS